jgi:arylsulfatase A-like enzyme
LATLLVAAGAAAFVSRRWLTATRHALGIMAVMPAMVVSMLALNPGLPPIGPLSSPRPTGGPNIILVTLDTVSAQHMSLYGYERENTPELEKLAEKATLYTRATATSNNTLPTHASIFTGNYGRRHGAHHFPPEFPAGRPLAPEARTLAETLAGSGYLTLAVVANVGYLCADYGLDQGFDLLEPTLPVALISSSQRQYLRNRLRPLVNLFTSTLEFDRFTRTAGEITADALQLLDEAAGKRTPFFLFLNYMDAHAPYLPPHPYDSMFPGKKATFTMDRYRVMTAEVARTGRGLTHEEYQHFTSQYDGAIVYLDHHIGRLVQRLEDLGLYTNTLVIITADHGEAFGENGVVGHDKTVFQSQVFVPLVVKFPGQTDSRVVNERVSQVDLTPTILEVAGLEPLPGIDGISLLQPAGRRPVISEAYSPSDPRQPVERAIFQGDIKLIAEPVGKPRVFNLADDPAEKRSLSGYPEATAMLDVLDGWVRSVSPPAYAPPSPSRRSLERLRDLGYIQ